MIEIRYTETFSNWLKKLRDHIGKAKILVRIDRLRLGLSGDNKSVGQGVSEIRIDFGPGYRIYYTKRGKELIILLVGGDKSSQNRDIQKAQDLAKQL
ncbi:MAG: type II toxin-antitoxin system RelE/ParE family toxin [Chitinivibrionales bacterium]